MDYRSAGVNVSEADQLVQWLKGKANSFSNKTGVVEGIGGFSALFRALFTDMKEPCLAATTDGVGTKLKLASYFQQYKEVGQDLVAMCLNDLICCGAKPLFFMDYYACGHLQQQVAREFLEGVYTACEQSDCPLLGGETAEMPDCYDHSDFDCAGFALGVVDRSKRLGSHNVKIKDKLVGVSSSGFHSNGFSLLRKIFAEDLQEWKAELLKPTALYVSLAQELFKVKGLKAIAHITGGGMDNLLRVLPKGVEAKMNAWEMPDIFQEVKKRTKMKWMDLLKTFNCGVGLVLIVSPSDFESVFEVIQKKHYSAYDLGNIIAMDSQGDYSSEDQMPTWSVPFSKWPSL